MSLRRQYARCQPISIAGCGSLATLRGSAPRAGAAASVAPRPAWRLTAPSARWGTRRRRASVTGWPHRPRQLLQRGDPILRRGMRGEQIVHPRAPERIDDEEVGGCRIALCARIVDLVRIVRYLDE